VQHGQTVALRTPGRKHCGVHGWDQIGGLYTHTCNVYISHIHTGMWHVPTTDTHMHTYMHIYKHACSPLHTNINTYIHTDDQKLHTKLWSERREIQEQLLWVLWNGYGERLLTAEEASQSAVLFQ
jgi:hypothetical protein